MASNQEELLAVNSNPASARQRRRPKQRSTNNLASNNAENTRASNEMNKSGTALNKSPVKQVVHDKVPNANNNATETTTHVTNATPAKPRRKRAQNQQQSPVVTQTEPASSSPNNQQPNITADQTAPPPPPPDKDNYSDKLIAVMINKLDGLEALNEQILRQNRLLISRPFIRVHFVDKSTGRPLTTRSIIGDSKEIKHLKALDTNRLDLPRSDGAEWNKELRVDGQYKDIVNEQTLVLFELIDVGNDPAVAVGLQKNLGQELKVAWAFLKPCGSDGKSNITGTSKARLQLFGYRKDLSGALKRLFHDSEGYEDGGCYRVYRQWKLNQNRRIKLNASLYITTRLLDVDPLLLKDNETLEQKQADENDNVSHEEALDAQGGEMEIPWRRMLGQKCLVPTQEQLRVETGKSGCSTIAFSSSGFYLAVACVSPSSYPIKVIDILGQEKIVTLSGNQDVVYELNWSDDERFISSASSDGTVRVWNVFEERINSPKLLAIFQHPCFTYTAKFMPNPQVVEEQSDDDDEMNPLLFSGAYDHLIRVWRVEGSASTGVIPDLSPIKTIEGHGACVNSLAFTKNGSLLVSGDGEGVIKVWTCDRYRGDDVIVECLHTINSSDSNAPVNYIHVHISDRKALITGRNGKLRVLDLRLGRFILEVEVPATAADKAARKPLISINSKQQHPNALSIGTAANNSMRRAIFSPCGSHIYVGGDVGRVHAFNSLTGDLLQTIVDQQDKFSITALSYHPFDYFLAYSGLNSMQPVVMLSAITQTAASQFSLPEVQASSTIAEVLQRFPLPPSLPSNKNIIGSSNILISKSQEI